MKLEDYYKKYTNLIILTVLIFYGFYLCLIGGYGSDEDTLPMIYVFEARLETGRFVSSRFTSYPIPEIGIGFLSYFFGSWAANSVTFIFFILGLIFIFLSFQKKLELEKLYFFLILCISSPILFFENLEPMDYSWAFLFFSIGLYFFSKKLFELAVLAFAFSVGCRLNFIIFVFLAIFFFNNNLISTQKRIIISICTFVTSGLFYLPVWFDNGFGLDWITAARPIEQGFLGLFARFSYKTWMAFGFVQLIIISIAFFKIYKKKIYFDNFKLLSLLTIFNLLLFLYIPAELSYLQPAIIFIYLILSKLLETKILLTIVIINFISWGINFEILKINYKDNDICSPKHATSASLDFSIKNGAIKEFFETRKMITCWINSSSERGRRILKGKSTRIK